MRQCPEGMRGRGGERGSERKRDRKNEREIDKWIERATYNSHRERKNVAEIGWKGVGCWLFEGDGFEV